MVPGRIDGEAVIRGVDRDEGADFVKLALISQMRKGAIMVIEQLDMTSAANEQIKPVLVRTLSKPRRFGR